MVYAMDWTLVLVAAITAIPATVAAVAAVLSAVRLHTPNGKNVGQLAEEAAHRAHRTDVIVTRTLGERDGDETYDGVTPQARMGRTVE